MSLKIVFEMQTILHASSSLFTCFPSNLTHVNDRSYGWMTAESFGTEINPFFICLVIRENTSKRQITNWTLSSVTVTCDDKRYLGLTPFRFTCTATADYSICRYCTFHSALSVRRLIPSIHPESFTRPPEEPNNFRSPQIQSSSIKKIYSQIFTKLKLKLFNYYLYKRKRLIWICFNFSSRNFIICCSSVFGKFSRLTGITIIPWRRF